MMMSMVVDKSQYRHLSFFIFIVDITRYAIALSDPYEAQGKTYMEVAVDHRE